MNVPRRCGMGHQIPGLHPRGVCLLFRNDCKYLFLWYCPIISHPVVLFAERQQITVIKTPVVYVIQLIGMVHAKAFAVELSGCAVQLAYAHLAQVSVALPDIPAFLLPCRRITETVIRRTIIYLWRLLSTIVFAVVYLLAVLA